MEPLAMYRLALCIGWLLIALIHAVRATRQRGKNVAEFALLVATTGVALLIAASHGAAFCVGF